MTAPKTPKPAKDGRTKPKAKPRQVDPLEPMAPVHLATGVGDDMIPVALLVKYQVYVEEFLKTLDTRDALKASKIAPDGASDAQIGGYLAAIKANPFVQTMIQNQYRAIMAKTGATVERVWEEIAYAAFLDPAVMYDDQGNPLPINMIPEAARRCITGTKVKTGTIGEDGEFVERELKFMGKDAAIDKLMRLHRMVDNDKLVIVDGDEFQKAMAEGRERARGKPNR